MLNVAMNVDLVFVPGNIWKEKGRDAFKLILMIYVVSIAKKLVSRTLQHLYSIISD